MERQCLTAYQPRGPQPHLPFVWPRAGRLRQRGWCLRHALTFLQLHTLEVEGVPQDVAAARLIFLGEEQQVRVGKQRHLHEERANRAGCSAHPETISHSLPRGRGNRSPSSQAEPGADAQRGLSQGQRPEPQSRLPFGLVLIVGEKKKKQNKKGALVLILVLHARWPLPASPQPDIHRPTSLSQRLWNLQPSALGLVPPLSYICLRSLSVWLKTHWTWSQKLRFLSH